MYGWMEADGYMGAIWIAFFYETKSASYHRITEPRPRNLMIHNMTLVNLCFKFLCVLWETSVRNFLAAPSALLELSGEKSSKTLSVILSVCVFWRQFDFKLSLSALSYSFRSWFCQTSSIPLYPQQPESPHPLHPSTPPTLRITIFLPTILIVF